MNFNENNFSKHFGDPNKSKAADFSDEYIYIMSLAYLGMQNKVSKSGPIFMQNKEEYLI